MILAIVIVLVAAIYAAVGQGFAYASTHGENPPTRFAWFWAFLLWPYYFVEFFLPEPLQQLAPPLLELEVDLRKLKAENDRRMKALKQKRPWSR